ncbi:MAG: PLDc N-terminal domain-containing protein [Promethearchaeota archaeon]
MLFTFPDLGMLGFLLFIPIILAIVWFVIAIAVAIWVYKDAKKRDMNAAVWLLIVLVTGCIGCIIYLVVRD